MRSLYLAVVFCFVTLLSACGSDAVAPAEEFDIGAEVDDTASSEVSDDTAPTEVSDDTGSGEVSDDASDAADSADTIAADGETGTTAPTISIDDVTIAEGNAGTVEATFTATLSAASTKPVTVAYATSDDTGTAGTDYVASAGTLTFAPGIVTQTIKITINGDTLDEVNETFKVTLSSPTEATIVDGEGLGTITDDDAAPTLSIDDVAIVEGNVGSVTAVLTVTLSNASGLPVTANFAAADGTATTADSDYAATSGTLTFAPGTTTEKVNVTINGDARHEANETVIVTLSAPTNATLAKAAGTLTIENDDAAPTVSIDDVNVIEGNTGTTSAAFTITLSAVSGTTVTVNYATSDGTASAASDYVAVPSTPLTFAPGEKTKTVSITINGDTTAEANETLNVNLSSPTNATLAKASGVGTIGNDDGVTVPTLSINDVSVTEGNSGTKVMTFTVTASVASTGTMTAAYATADGTATASSDYVSTSGVVTFSAGETSKTISVTINGDAQYETDETFTVTLSSPTGAALAKSTGTGTITNDDAQPTLSISNASVTEGASGLRAMTFTVSLSAAAGVPVTVNYATADGTATAGGSSSSGGGDYATTSGTLNFAPGVVSQSISVIVGGDTLNEADEIFTVTLSAPTNATIATPTGTGTIVNDDAMPTLRVGDASGAEGNSGTTTLTFPVTLSAPSGRTVTIAYATSNGTASAGSDYVAASGTITFAAGQTVQAVSVQINGDTAAETNENFTVTLSSPTNATILDGTGQGTIFNDDGSVPLLNIGDATAAEFNAGTGTMTFTVTMSAASTMSVTVDYATSNNTAIAGSDYTAATGTVTFMPGETSKTITVSIAGDTLDESDETLFVTLSNAINASIARARGTGTITDDDAAPTLSIGDATVNEGDSGTTSATITVTLSTASGRTVTVNYATADNTAVAGGPAITGRNDYVTTSGTLTFAPGELSKTIALAINGEIIDEPDTETFNVGLSTAVNATIADALGVVTIVDDDAGPTVSIADRSDTEGGVGTTKPFTITVSLSTPSARTVTVAWATANGTATSSGFDYFAASGTITFNPGETTKTINVTVVGNNTTEPDETFFVNLSSPTNATIADASATVTIVNDD